MRYILIDMLKVIALIAMLIYHWWFYQFYLHAMPLSNTVELTGWLARFLFLFLFGFNFSFSKSKTFKSLVSRLNKLIAAAVLVSVVSYIYQPSLAIYFGVLHLFVFSAIVLFFLRTRVSLILLISSVSVLGFVLPMPSVSFNHLLFLGLHNTDFASFDYFAFYPYFSFIGFGYWFAHNFKEQLRVDYTSNIYSSLCSFLARHSLAIYLLHLPVIVLFDYMWR